MVGRYVKNLASILVASYIGIASLVYADPEKESKKTKIMKVGDLEIEIETNVYREEGKAIKSRGSLYGTLGRRGEDRLAVRLGVDEQVKEGLRERHANLTLYSTDEKGKLIVRKNVHVPLKNPTPATANKGVFDEALEKKLYKDITKNTDELARTKKTIEWRQKELLVSIKELSELEKKAIYEAERYKGAIVTYKQYRHHKDSVYAVHYAKAKADSAINSYNAARKVTLAEDAYLASLYKRYGHLAKATGTVVKGYATIADQHPERVIDTLIRRGHNSDELLKIRRNPNAIVGKLGKATGFVISYILLDEVFKIAGLERTTTLERTWNHEFTQSMLTNPLGRINRVWEDYTRDPLGAAAGSLGEAIKIILGD
jgi:hypothetical protein